jgi:hypothetical protein
MVDIGMLGPSQISLAMNANSRVPGIVPADAVDGSGGG